MNEAEICAARADAVYSEALENEHPTPLARLGYEPQEIRKL